jgi:hypothetical protein
MKLMLCGILMASATALAADAPTLNGKWNVHLSIAGNDSDTMCVFTQKEADLTGSCTSDGVEHPLTGKVDGQVFTWSYKSDYQGSPLTVKYKGSLDPSATKLKGTVVVDEFGVDGDFSGEPSK